MKSAFHIWVFLIHSSQEKKVLLFFSNDFLSKKIHQWKNHTFKMRTAAAFHTDKEWKNSDMTFWNFCGLDRYSPLCMQANYQLISSTAPHLSKGTNEAFVNVPLCFLNQRRVPFFCRQETLSIFLNGVQIRASIIRLLFH